MPCGAVLVVIYVDGERCLCHDNMVASWGNFGKDTALGLRVADCAQPVSSDGAIERFLFRSVKGK